MVDQHFDRVAIFPSLPIVISLKVTGRRRKAEDVQQVVIHVDGVENLRHGGIAVR